MWHSTKATTTIGILLISFLFVSAKTSPLPQSPLEMELRVLPDDGNMLSHVLKVINHGDSTFQGLLSVSLPEGFRSISREDRNVTIAPGDSSFVSFKLLLTKDLEAGEKQIRYHLYNNKREIVSIRETALDIEQQERIVMLTDQAPPPLTNPDDSVRIHVTMNNMGNVTEHLTLVFNVPNLRTSSPFTEVTASLAPGEQRDFTHRFIASGNLLEEGRFQVFITAMKGSERKIVDSKSVTVHIVSSRRNYDAMLHDQLYRSGEGSLDNAIQLSYRTYNNSSSTLQLQGGHYQDLPAGYLHLKGNIYKYDNQSTPYVTNTSLTYRYLENELTVGNVSEQAELSLYGRGAKAIFSDRGNNKRLSFGVVDQNYNLLSSNPWFNDYYSFFAKGELGASSRKSGTSLTYVFQQNPYEKARYHMTSLAWRYLFNDKWQLEVNTHGALSQYQEVEINKFTGAAELRYRGVLFSDMMLNGSAYYSDPYFAGNRKGSISLSQSISKKIIDEIYLSGSFSYNVSEPKSYRHDYNYRSENTNGSFSVSLPKIVALSSSLNYSYRKEGSESYARFLGEDIEDSFLTMTSHRVGWQWRWQSTDRHHSLQGTLEGGLYNNPIDKEYESQGKSSLNYAYRWLNLGATWQQGAYFLYEQMTAQQQNKPFSRLTLSASVNHQFSQRLSISSGFNFTRELYRGDVPSLNLNSKYAFRNGVSLFLNGSWYKYQFMRNQNMLNIEGGIRYQFKKGEPQRGKKSTLIGKVYYDHNANNRYDQGDVPAEGYLLEMNKQAFVSGRDGEVRYSSLPFGNYSVKPMQAGEWSFDQQEISVDRYKTRVEIPLRQSGTLRGNIRYITNENSVEIVQRNEGFRFTIVAADNKLKQTVVTDGQGNFITFLPSGDYSITLDQRTLPEHTECKTMVRYFTIEGSKVTEIEPFDIEVKTRRVNVRKFFAQKKQ